MSGKRGPKRSSFGPISGLALQIDVIADHDQRALRNTLQLMPPAAFVRITARIPMRAQHAHRENHFLRRVALIEMHAALHRRHGHSPTLPITSRPAWPMAVERGKPGIFS